MVKVLKEMNLKYIVLIILLSTWTASAADYAVEDEKLGLTNAISISLDNNNRYKIAREKVKEKEYKVRETWGQLWPEFSSGITRTWWDYEKGALSSSDGETNIQLVKGTLAVNPGAFYGRLSSTREERIISVHEERKIKAETVIASIQLYYRVLLANDVVKLHKDSVKALEENLRIVEVSYKAGSQTKLVYLRAKVAVANEKTTLINARKDFDRARSAFNIHIGREIDSPVNLDAESLTLEKESDLKLINMNEDEKIGYFSEFVTLALQNRPELLMIKHRKKLIESNIVENDSVYMWPTFFISGSYGLSKINNPVTNISTGYPDPTLDLALNGVNETLNPEGWNKNWNFTVGASYRWGALSPFDSSGDRSRQLKSLSSQADMEMEDFMKNIKLDIQECLLELEAASRAYLTQKENVMSAEESFRVAAIQFKNGIIDNTILLNANVELSSARAMYVQSLFNFQGAKAKLNKSLGCDYFKF